MEYEVLKIYHLAIERYESMLRRQFREHTFFVIYLTLWYGAVVIMRFMKFPLAVIGMSSAIGIAMSIYWFMLTRIFERSNRQAVREIAEIEREICEMNEDFLCGYSRNEEIFSTQKHFHYLALLYMAIFITYPTLLLIEKL